jgi:lipopolysaccharide transport system ATP-binding protein
MSAPIVQIENLGKRFTLGESHKNDGLRHRLESLFRDPLNFFKSQKKSFSSQEFWALRNVCFDVQPGEVVGIIGRNGAGKSTLLKLLSRVTSPTEGRITLRGRVASLLEVGTGFHPELSGRENIFLNGIILGMTQAEIRKQFDAIVDFAGVAQFLDTPVKRYSSGMYVRLAFAVAAHLRQEILLVDEVLAVGDHAFQQKCIGKMQDVSRSEGRTVLFVSHNMATLLSLCQNGVWLDKGAVKFMGKIQHAINEYLGYQREMARANQLPSKPDAPVAFESIKLLSEDQKVGENFDVRESIFIELTYRIKTFVPALEVSCRVENGMGVPIFTVDRSNSNSDTPKAGLYKARLKIPAQFLAPDRYAIVLGLHVPQQQVIDVVPNAISFVVEETGSRQSRYGTQAGVVLVDIFWDEKLV